MATGTFPAPPNSRRTTLFVSSASSFPARVNTPRATGSPELAAESTTGNKAEKSGGGDAFAQALPGVVTSSTMQQDFNQFRILLGYGHPNKRGFSGATAFGFDANLGFLQYATVQTSYAWDCCGVSVEYRRFALGSVRNENQFRFSFNLANVGSFGNLRKQERLY